MQQLLAMGAVGKLPEEMQWTVRMLLPRKDEPAAAAAKAAQAVAGPPALQFPGLQLNYLPQQVAMFVRHCPDTSKRPDIA